MKKSAFYVSLGMLALSTTSFAAMAGPYIGFSIGSGGMVTDKPSHSASVTETHNYRSLVTRTYGGYLWDIQKVSNLKLGAELGYLTIQHVAYMLNTQRWDYNSAYNIDLLGVARYNIVNSKFYVLGKAGVAFAHQTVDMSGYGNPISSTKNRLLPELGLGFGYDFTQHWDANIMLTHVFGSSSPKFSYGTTSLNGIDKVVSTGALTIGIAYHF